MSNEIEWPYFGFKPDELDIAMPKPPQNDMLFGITNAICVTHKATGISAECNTERSQYENRAKALKLLRERVDARQIETKTCSGCGYAYEIECGNPYCDAPDRAPVAPPAPADEVYECLSCGHIYQESVSSCDCASLCGEKFQYKTRYVIDMPDGYLPVSIAVLKELGISLGVDDEGDPTHCHLKPGIWDDTGAACSQCLIYNELRALIRTIKDEHEEAI